MEHAPGSWDRHGAGSRRPDRRVRAVLPWRPHFSSRPSTTPNDDVPHALRCWAFGDLPDPYARPVVVHTPGVDTVGGGIRNSGRGNAHFGLWRLARDAAWLEVCRDRLGLCLRLVPPHRSGEAACLPHIGPFEGRVRAEGSPQAAIGNRCPGARIKSLIIFDLHGTLAESKSDLDAEMAALLARLLGTS